MSGWAQVALAAGMLFAAAIGLVAYMLWPTPGRHGLGASAEVPHEGATEEYGAELAVITGEMAAIPAAEDPAFSSPEPQWWERPAAPDETAPLYREAGPPPPLEWETFTNSWTRTQLLSVIHKSEGDPR